MALRVLLADESPTIKKVFQLALQDFAVEVRPVNIGIDVATVAANFKPDLIFADVLLQKKNGYEVCAELKQDALLGTIPVVLMWSGFMELDEDKYQACQANAQLEKPFDVAALRKLVADLVPRTQKQRISEFLTFPDAQAPAEPPPAPAPAASLDEEFTDVPMPKMKGAQADKYRLALKPEELEAGHIPVDYKVPDDAPAAEPFKMADEADAFAVRVTKKAPAPEAPPRPPQMAAEVKSKPSPPPLPKASTKVSEAPEESELDMELDEVLRTKVSGSAPSVAASIPASGGLTASQLEKIIREQSADVIESVVWKVIPEMAAQIIERELNKLLKERDSHHF
jgi:two-component system cell cycle response regulator